MDHSALLCLLLCVGMVSTMLLLPAAVFTWQRAMTSPEVRDRIALGSRIARARRARRVSQQELAAHLQITDRQMRNIERGSSPVSADRLAAIARILDLPRSALLDPPEAPFPPRTNAP